VRQRCLNCQRSAPSRNGQAFSSHFRADNLQELHSANSPEQHNSAARSSPSTSSSDCENIAIESTVKQVSKRPRSRRESFLFFPASI
ncbi:hypothetical protein V5799_014406, partial [Amblyomma americanum]